MNSIKTRALHAINLQQFNAENSPELVDVIPLAVPDERQYVLRMLIRKPFQDFKVPSELGWLMPLIWAANEYQKNVVQVIHPYCYLTVRSGLVESVTDDEWHTDGFSMGITHLPEQNYGWSNIHPTEFVNKAIKLPSDFSPFKHNLHQYIQDTLVKEPVPINVGYSNTLYCFDPYVIHRRPQVPAGVKRAFVRISFTPIEICDDGNTQNPLLPVMPYNRDAVKEYRNKLERYYI
jgi:hypothetical protein